MTPQPTGQGRGSATPGAAMRTPAGVAQAGTPRPRTDPWPGRPPAQGAPRQQPVPQQPMPQQQPPRAGQPQMPAPYRPQAPQQQRPPQQPRQGQQPQQRPGQQGGRAASAGVGRRWLGVVAFLVLAGLSLPVHVLALFFAFVEFASPGDASTAALLVVGAFVGSFVALLVTATVSQLIGGFTSRWRVRITFAVANAALALAVALIASLTLF